MKDRFITTFLEDMTYNTKFEFLEESKDKDELNKIAEAKGIRLPAHDLSIFKGRYAYIDRMNKNNCTLPAEEVEKALDTLAGKAVDFDHFRKRVVGYWIDAKVEGDEIIAYGIFFKGNFSEDYETIKELMEKDVLAISFEAWGDKDVKEDGSYNLTDIEFAGGALLIKESPAFPGSEVLEMANKNRVLEFAKVMTKPESFVHTGKDEKPEEARYYAYDISAIFSAVSEIECVNCKEKGFFDIDSIDFVKNKAGIRCMNCISTLAVDLTPAVKLTSKGRKVKSISEEVASSSIEDYNKFIEEFPGTDERLEMMLEESFDVPTTTYTQRCELTDEDFAVVKNINIDNASRKVRLFPIHDPAQIHIAQVRLEQSQVNDMLDKLGVDKDNVHRKILRRAKQTIMKDLLEKFKTDSIDTVFQEVAKSTIGRELTDDELTKAYNIVDLKASGGGSNATSLLSLKGKSVSNETSLMTAMTEDEIKAVVTEITKAAEDETPAEEAKPAEDETPAEEAKPEVPAEETPAETPAEETPAEDAKDKEIAMLKEKLEKFEKADTDAKLKARKDELGEIAKDMSDEDIMDETKFALAKKDKEIADLKAGKVDAKPKKPDLTKGSDDKDPLSPEAESRAKVNEYAWDRKDGLKNEE